MIVTVVEKSIDVNAADQIKHSWNELLFCHVNDDVIKFRVRNNLLILN